MAMITAPDVYFRQGCGRCARFATPACSVQLWQEGLLALRRICVDLGLQECAKWGHPTYMHAGRNIALLGAFRDDFRLNLMHAALIRDEAGLLAAPGDDTGASPGASGSLRFTSAADVQAQAPVIRAYLQQLMAHAEAGTKPPKTTGSVAMPEELAAALQADPVLAKAFQALTPGRQKSYLLNLQAAKQAATRLARIEKFRPKILAGKGALDR